MCRAADLELDLGEDDVPPDARRGRLVSAIAEWVSAGGGEPVAGVLAPGRLDREGKRCGDGDDVAREVELDLGEADVAAEVGVEGLVDGFLDREAEGDGAITIGE